jgi:hypothetical protein
MNLDDWIQTHFIFLACSAVTIALGAWVVYLFYARLRDIADELRKLRITYQFANEREAQRRSDASADPANSSGQPLASTPENEK